ARARGALARGHGGGIRRGRLEPAVRRAPRLPGRRPAGPHACLARAVPAHRPDVGVVHAQRADRHGNVQLWGILGVQKEVVLASKRSIATVEEIVDELEPVPGAIVLPAWVVTAVAPAPGGAHPSYAHGYYDRDNEFYRAWDTISRERDGFVAWMKRHVLETADVEEYRASLVATVAA